MTVVTPVSAADRAYQRVRGWLQDGTFPPGSMLSENDLAARLDVSRTPVRSAVRRLEAEGWLTIYPKRGALVRGLSVHEAIAVSDARQVLESAYVDSLTDAAHEQLCDRLESMMEAERAEYENGSYEKLVQLTIDFHRAFVEVGGNPLLLEFYDRLRERQSVMTLQTRDTVAGRWDDFHAEHRRLIECMRARDREGFVRELGTHIAATHGPLMRSN